MRSIVLAAIAAMFACGDDGALIVDATNVDALAEVDGATDDANIDAPSAFTLTVAAAGNGTGAVVSSPSGIDCGTDCDESFSGGSEVTLTATAAAGSTFVGWSGGSCSGTGSCTVTVTEDVTVAAMFALDNSVVVMKSGTGTGSVTSSPAGISCGQDCTESYPVNTMVTLTATPAPMSTFVGWSGACSGTGPCVVSTATAIGVTARFDLVQFALTVTKAGTGSGGVQSSPAGIDCGTNCMQMYPAGTDVTLTATPAMDSMFVGWSGGCTGTGPCVVDMTAARTVTATFALQQRVLTVARAGAGTGTVTSNPAGITCGADCMQSYPHGTDVTLTATPAVDSTFVGWSGGCTGTGPCVVDMIAAHTVTATFALQQRMLTVTKAGAGVGTVTSNPAGITCGTDCTQSYPHGTDVTLTAAPAVGSTFVGWSNGCTGAGTCVLDMTAARTVTATFAIARHTLTVTLAGSVVGVVTSNPAGIDCPNDCNEAYDHGTIVSLRADDTSDAQFTGWSGPCPMPDFYLCEVSMTEARQVIANFSVPYHPLTISIAGQGAVTSNPAGINCGTDCDESYVQGTAVTLTATPAPGWRLRAWGEIACPDPTVQCTVDMAGNQSLFTEFEPIPQFALMVQKSGTGGGTVTSAPAGINCGSDCSETYQENTVVVLTATPTNAAHVLAGWSGGGCSGNGPTCTVTMNQAHTVTAKFQLLACDSFNYANGTTVPNWTERNGDWYVRDGSIYFTGTLSDYVITRNNPVQLDSCVRATVKHSGVAVEQSVGAVLRWTSSASDKALLYDSNLDGVFDAMSFADTLFSNRDYGSNPTIELCARGTELQVRVDVDRNGSYEHVHTRPALMNVSGLFGARASQQAAPSSPAVEQVCWWTL